MLRPTAPLFKVTKSSRAWLARQGRDPYVTQRVASHGPSKSNKSNSKPAPLEDLPRSYRSRAAYKLLELDDKYHQFLTKPSVRAVVDLGAAPGGWSQVVAERHGFSTGWDFEEKGMGRGDPSSPSDDWSSSPSSLPQDTFPEPNTSREQSTILALDILPMLPIPGVHSLTFDFLRPDAPAALRSLLSARGHDYADVVLSDIAANMSGNRTRDVESSLDICRGVYEFCLGVLRPEEPGCDRPGGGRKGGALLIKHFNHPLLTEFRREHLEPQFRNVYYVKPDASRSDSSEGYWLCRGFRGPPGSGSSRAFSTNI
ncbi:23S ribosomal RNA methyltransferase [Coniophora puteana RWD-64-598 SS2]|uniref:rRNA methyltransferase 2, mitochondrial n=1 Tax=Coniophora puteana (strain RWD-64-598) TaxID=741705 RepID=A0A5M3MG10_CONPW|nr:23S ribosomal RNA methyltransferase [Coniophora puteana RWD-64-598 SS2]EIW77860.1 23S ribosomal RNA methyltransferase [Coniophora puteana RWD-64-598 SS2]